MDALSARLRKEELDARQRLLEEFDAARRDFIQSVLEGRREAVMYARRIWVWFTFLIMPVPVFYRTKTVIELKGEHGLSYVTTEGQFVDDPGGFFAFWHASLRDSLFKSYESGLSNEELVSLTRRFRGVEVKMGPKRRKFFSWR